MKLVTVREDRAVIELETAEIATIVALSSGALNADQYPSDPTALAHELAGCLAAIGERAEEPFKPGQPVHVTLRVTGPVPELLEGQRAVVLSVHGEDETRDYPWCKVRLDSGRELDLPQLMLVRE